MINQKYWKMGEIEWMEKGEIIMISEKKKDKWEKMDKNGKLDERR